MSRLAFGVPIPASALPILTKIPGKKSLARSWQSQARHKDAHRDPPQTEGHTMAGGPTEQSAKR
jgi:hypothetical protein